MKVVDRSREICVMPVSFCQERLWFLEQFEPGTALYNIPFMNSIEGKPDSAAFNRAANQLIERHESLRTAFKYAEGEPQQTIYTQISVEVPVIRLGTASEREKQVKLQEIFHAFTLEPFDLLEAPLLRLGLIDLGGATAIVSVMHHIISDGWSVGIFQRELLDLYRAQLKGEEATLAPLPIQYGDYAVWQRELLQNSGQHATSRYWQQTLRACNTFLQLPTDYQRPLKQTFKGDIYRFELSESLTNRVKTLAEQQGVTLFMLLFSIFAIFLYRLTAEKDFLVGTPIAGRNRTELEGLIGFFVNTLVLRTQLDGGWTFQQLLEKVKSQTLQAFDHQEMPFEKLVMELNPKRDLSHNPLVQILFSFQNTPPLETLVSTQASRKPKAAFSGHTATSKFDFALFMAQDAELIECTIEYNTDLYKAQTVAEYAQYFTHLLAEIAERSLNEIKCDIESLPLIDNAHKKRLLDRWSNLNAAQVPAVSCSQWFEQQAQATPQAIAVRYSGAETHCQHLLTYRQLNEKANQLAGYLRAQGVKPGDPVGLCLPRGVEQIVTLLAVVKLAGVYLPLDPEYPERRCRAMLEDAQAKIVLTRSDVAFTVPNSSSAIFIDQLEQALRDFCTDNIDQPIEPENPLYIVYTSGSTGRPKGVVMPHSAIVNLVYWQQANSPITQGAVTLQYASLNFDVASQEIWSTLTAGGCLQLLDENTRRDSERLLVFLKTHSVERLFLPPVALLQLASHAAQDNVELSSLREVIVAGEKLQITDNCRRFFAALPHARLVNQYGPSESHVVCAYTLPVEVAHWPNHPPIGKAIYNAELYLLDERMQPVPDRVAGELYIGGKPMALGYLRQPQQTAARFKTHILEQQRGPIYRTGDLCRYRGDGNLEFIGRVDDQIKLRGYRIEPGEIEVALQDHPDIKQAAVVKRQTPNGDDQLLACLVLREEAVLNPTALRAFLSSRLPLYMIPAYFRVLEALPLTATGKLDRLRLPDLPQGKSATSERYVAPVTPIEVFLATVWCELLQRKQVGIEDNFFELGGHSLTATQLVSRIRHHYSIELPLFLIFDRPTIVQLAVEIVKLQAQQESESDVEALLREVEGLSDEDSEKLLSEYCD